MFIAIYSFFCRLAVSSNCDFLVGKNRSSSNLSVVRACLVFLSLLLLSVKLIAHPAVVVIDPGHGGIDRGGMPGQRLPEKPYTLDVAKRLARILDGTDDIKVVLTRTGDYFVPLPWDTALSLFRSISMRVGARAPTALRPTTMIRVVIGWQL